MSNALKKNEKSFIMTLLLCLFFGCFGAHRFYTGYNKIGIVQCLLLVSIIGISISIIWMIIDFISIIFNKYKTADGLNLVNEIAIKPNKTNIILKYNYNDDSADVLLKMATKKRTDNIDEAISFLKRAYCEIAKTKIDYPIDTFLRLPLYLQEAGRPNEALNEFNNLLQNGYPNQHKIKELIPMHESKIYDKMRLFWQREKNPCEAISYGIYSLLLDALGLYRQKREVELNSIKDKSHIIERIIPLFKKANRLDLIDRVADIIIFELNKLPNISTHQEIKILVFNMF